MASLSEAWEHANGRLQGVVEAGRRGELSMVAATTAGTDVAGPDLSVRIGIYSDWIVREFLELLGEPVEEDLTTEEMTVQLRDFVYRHNNGTALSWFWAGYELRRLEEVKPDRRARLAAATGELKVAMGPRLDGLTDTLIENAARQVLDAAEMSTTEEER